MAARVRRVPAVVACCLLLVGTACAPSGPGSGPGSDADPDPVSAGEARPGTEPSSADPSGAADDGESPPVAEPDLAVDPPPPLEESLLPADLLVYSQEEIPPRTLRRIASLDGVEGTTTMAMAQVPVENRLLVLAAVDPASYRRFTPPNSAQNEEIWQRVAGGELAIPPRLGKRLQDEDAFVGLGNEKDAPRVHIGAYADQALQVDAVVNEKWGEELGMTPGNALLISTGPVAPQSLRSPVERIVGAAASVQNLDAVARYGLDLDAKQTAFLTGGSVSQAVGSFSYRALGGGRIAPDPAWVAANIRTERVPILGSVTCHRAVLPQLRSALSEVVERGLADTINPGEYAGCYYPRFIAGSTKLSLHSFGIALDLNTPGNQRGTVGEMDRTVVSIFKSWGFAWGGDWNYTDPMHFEMNAIVEPR
ncbi:M15 family metallopeptidase [Nocardioides donggukensis]|uniref:M15 family metallopeptidase n=1 Tax=Nocardioides donggukensis TaxID=2774019 RepID=A0A927PYF7_9ACTN|nr:M15 family metallopeptidase [Nocardioides donggukensis]MBD8868063.1 M15 family metallopeptidase [Nocardioides donggukensis]